MEIKRFNDFEAKPTNYFVVLTFDIEDTKEYVKIEQELNSIGFFKTIENKKAKETELPANTFALEVLMNSTTKELREELSNKVESVFKELELKGKYFLELGTHWAWIVKPFDFN